MLSMLQMASFTAMASLVLSLRCSLPQRYCALSYWKAALAVSGGAGRKWTAFGICIESSSGFCAKPISGMRAIRMSVFFIV